MDAKYALDNERKNKCAKRVFARSSSVIFEMHLEIKWDKGINIKGSSNIERNLGLSFSKDSRQSA